MTVGTLILLWLLAGCASPTKIPEVGVERVEGKLWFQCANEGFSESSVCYMNLDGTWQVLEIVDSVYGTDVLASGTQVVATSFAPGSDTLTITALDMNNSWRSHSVYVGGGLPRLSPDGNRVAFLIEGPTGEYQLGWSNWDSSGFQKLAGWGVDSYSWMADSRSIIMSASSLQESAEQIAASPRGIYRVDTLTLEVNEVVPPPSPLSGFQPSSSPDGKMIAYFVGVGRTTSKLIILDIGSNKEMASLQVGVRAQFQWSPDSKSIAYFAGDRAASQSCTAGELFDNLHIFEIGGSDRLAFDTSSLTCASTISSNSINLLELSWSPTGDLIALHWLEGDNNILAIIQPDGHLVGKLPVPSANFEILNWTP
jgi:Tol biopolymer transport system component